MDARPIIDDLWQRARAKGKASIKLDNALTVVAERNGSNRVAFGKRGAWPSNLEVDLFAAQIGIPETAVRIADQRDGYQVIEYTWPATTVEQPTLDLDLGPIVQPEGDEHLSLDERFQRFHAANPHVYAALVRLARELQASGCRKFGMKLLVEQLRWRYAMATSGDSFKLNNNWTSRYNHMMLDEHPEFNGVLETRTLRS